MDKELGKKDWQDNLESELEGQALWIKKELCRH